MLCVASHHYKICDLRIPSERANCQREKGQQSLASCEVLLQDIPELRSYREINKVMNQLTDSSYSCSLFIQVISKHCG